jgi:hypothetical protein
VHKGDNLTTSDNNGTTSYNKKWTSKLWDNRDNSY